MLTNLFSPVAGAMVARLVHPYSWDATMTAYAQIGGFAATFAIGVFALGLPWYAVLVAGFIVGITSYATRVG